MLQIPCPHCHRTVASDDHLRFPPWCPKCGADFKATPKDVATATPAPAEPEIRKPSLLTTGLLPGPLHEPLPPEPSPIRQPPYFEARLAGGSRRQYRVYVCDDELLFLDRTPYAAPAGRMLAYMCGGLLGALAFHAATKGARDQVAARLREMDWSDDIRLRMMADEDPNSFRVLPEDMSDVSVEPPTFWQRWGVFRARCAGMLCFRDALQGPVRLELPEEGDMRRVLRDLPEWLDGAVAVNAAWDAQRQCYGPAG